MYLQTSYSQKIEMECSQEIYNKIKSKLNYEEFGLNNYVKVIATVNSVNKTEFYPQYSGNNSDGYEITFHYSNDNVVRCKCIDIALTTFP